jgi:polysaccharide biosynthesis/export protein
MSNRNYPVTPGDTYLLRYSAALATVSEKLLVDSDYMVSVDQFGVINVRGFTLSQMRSTFSRLVLSAYPNSSPTLQLTSVGIFQAIIRGEVPASGYVATWELACLSDVLEGYLSSSSSLRSIKISRDGEPDRIYDVVEAISLGDIDQNPLLRPGGRTQNKPNAYR